MAGQRASLHVLVKPAIMCPFLFLACTHLLAAAAAIRGKGIGADVICAQTDRACGLYEFRLMGSKAHERPQRTYRHSHSSRAFQFMDRLNWCTMIRGCKSHHLGLEFRIPVI